MKKTMLGIALGSLLTLSPITSLNAQGDNPQPTCHMCPGDLRLRSMKSGLCQKSDRREATDQQVREVGHRQVQRRHWHPSSRKARFPRGRTRSRNTIWSARSITSSTGRARWCSGRISSASSVVPRPTDRASSSMDRETTGPDSQSNRLSAQGRRRRHHSGRHRALVHQDRRSHHLSHGSHRSRQGHTPKDEAASKAYLAEQSR